MVAAKLSEAQPSSVAAPSYAVLVGVAELVASGPEIRPFGFELVRSAVAVAVLVEVDVSSCEYCPNSMF